MAEVWRATDLLLHRTVAIKLFTAGTVHGARHRAEAVALASLSHPGLVTVFDAVLVDDEAGQPSFLVTEFIDGPNLRRQLDTSGPEGIPGWEVAQLGTQLADALAYVHAAGIVHRDVKPANILLDRVPSGTPMRAKLADFGIALLSDHTRLTEHGNTVGTANYLSPEQVSGSEVGPASDIYSFGLLLIECLTGRLAYPGNGIEAAVARLHRQPELPEHASAPWRRLLTAMVALDPHDRPTAAMIADALGQLHDAVETATPAVATTEMPKPEMTAEDGSTRVLDGNQIENQQPLELSSTRTRLVTAPVPARFPSPWVVLTVATSAVIAIIIVVVVATAAGPGSTDTNNPTPPYPTVTGTLGRDLANLQHDVQP